MQQDKFSTCLDIYRLASYKSSLSQLLRILHILRILRMKPGIHGFYFSLSACIHQQQISLNDTI